MLRYVDSRYICCVFLEPHIDRFLYLSSFCFCSQYTEPLEGDTDEIYLSEFCDEGNGAW